MAKYDVLVQLEVGDRKFLNVVEMFELSKEGTICDMSGYKFIVKESDNELKIEAAQRNASMGAMTAVLQPETDTLDNILVINSLLVSYWKEKQ